MSLLRFLSIFVGLFAVLLSTFKFGSFMDTSTTINESTRLQNYYVEKQLSYLHDNMNNINMNTQDTLDLDGKGLERSDEVFRLLTFNTWGLKYVSKFRRERLTAIAERLAGLKNNEFPSYNSDWDNDDYDIVALQEIWTKEDWDYIDRICASKFPFRRWFSSGILSGPGLAILSKYPIKKTSLYRFPVNGRPSAFFRGDWYVGKSVAVTILKLNNGSTIALLNSHMHAPYAKSGDAAYETHRACQAWEIANIVNDLKSAGHAVILVGDLNSRPGSIPYEILQKEAGLADSWEVINGETDLELVKAMQPWEQIVRAATTCDSILNTWRADRNPDEACRLDYALIDKNLLHPVEASVKFTEKIPNVGSYSDHFAYSVNLRLNKEPLSKITATECPNNDLLGLYLKFRNLVNNYIQTTLEWQRQWRLWHFVLSMFIAIAFIPVIIVVSYRAPWSSVLFYFFGCIIFSTGLVNGMISFLFGRYELRNLREVIFEIDDRTNFLKHVIQC